MKIKNKPLVWYFLFTILSGMHLFSAVMVIFYKDWGGLNQFQIQTLQSVFSVGIVLLEIPTGLVADLVGRKQSLILGSFIAALGFVLYGSFSGFSSFLVAELIISLGFSLISGANSALLFEILEKQKKEHELQKIRGRVRAAKLLTYAFSAQLGSKIASLWGLNAPMFLTALPIFMATFAVMMIPEEKKEKTKKGESKIQLAMKGLIILKDKKIFRLAINGALVNSSAYFLIWFYQPLIRKLGMPLESNGVFYSAMVLVEAVIAANFGRIGKYTKRYLDFSALVTGISFLLAGLFPSPATLTALLLFAGGFGLTRMELVNSKIQLLTPSENHATLLSAVSLLAKLVLIPLNPLVGLVADKSLSLAFLLVGTIPFLVLVFLPVRPEEE